MLTGPDRIARIGAKKPQRMLLIKQIRAVVSFSYKGSRICFLPECMLSALSYCYNEIFPGLSRTTVALALISPNPNVGDNYTFLEI